MKSAESQMGLRDQACLKCAILGNISPGAPAEMRVRSVSAIEGGGRQLVTRVSPFILTVESWETNTGHRGAKGGPALIFSEFRRPQVSL